MRKFTGWTRQAALVLSVMLVSAGASAQVTWTTVGGKVAGAQNVSVLGSFYDVVFGDTYLPVPEYLNEAFALAGAQALVDQVFVSGAPLNLDALPSALAGCEDTTYGVCNVYTLISPTLNVGGPAFAGVNLSNRDGLYSDFADQALAPLTTGPAYLPYFTLASWSSTGSVPVSAVPEPETYAMMLVGLGVMGTIVRRRKARQSA